MMTRLFWIFVFVSLGHYVHSATKTIEKRQICSSGGCNTCDGRSCNSCNNNVCCSSVSCNQCVNQCANDCNTVSCKNNCVTGCASSCQTPSCTSQSCSQCVNRCSNSCSNRECASDCSNRCNSCKEQVITKETTSDSENVIVVPSSEPASVIVNNTNNNLVNLTTHININNVVHNLNNISIPIFVNSTNINNINLSTDETHESIPAPIISGNSTSTIIRPEVVPIPYPYYIPSARTREENNNCCYVLHPRQCYTDEEGQARCFVRRSRECSNACTSPVVTIEQGSETTNTGCQFVRSWPYAYCGNYVRGDCNQCYSCGGSYNPGECFRQGGCSDTCRRSAPNCVPSQSGLQCY